LTNVRRENPQDKAFAELEILFSAAASIEAIKIFYAAKDGIKSSTQAIRDLDLTQKKYYTHLKRLIDAGLVERVNGVYKHTTLGKIGFKLAEAFMNAVTQKDRLDLIDRLSKAKNITLDETEEIMRAILKDTNIIPGDRITDILGPVRMADTWEKVVQDVVEYINKAEEEVFFATQYLDSKVVEAIFEASNRGIKFNFLISDKNQMFNGMKFLVSTFFTNPKALKTILEILPSTKLRVRTVDVPYTFIVVDKKVAMVEVTKPNTKTFSLAFFFHNERLCERLIESFNVLWERGNEVGLFEGLLKEKEFTD
ncbi:MAG: phospholipase D-like domain-containing protein, partial [Candidatus Bathyarchaeia archaeon]